MLCVAADDRAARDLATELGAYLAPRRVRLLPLAWDRLRVPPGAAAAPRRACGSPPSTRSRGARRPTARRRSSSPAPSRSPRRSRTPRSALRASRSQGRGDGPRRRRRAARRLRLRAGRAGHDRGQFAVRGGILDVFGSTEDRAARIELFGDEVESIRWFSTFTQRSLGEAERIELDPPPRSIPTIGSSPRRRSPTARNRGDRPLAELLPTDRFGAFLDLIDERTAIIVAASEEIGPALRDHGTDVRAAIHDEDVAKLYVEVQEPLAARARARIHVTGDDAEGDDGPAGIRGSIPVSAARIARGGGARAREAGPLGLLDRRRVREHRRGGARPLHLRAPEPADPRRWPGPGLPGRPLRRGAAHRRLRLPGAEAGGDPVPAPRPPPPRRPRRLHRAVASPRSATSRPASTSSTRTTASPASPASTPARSPGSPATTSSSSTATATRSSSRPSSWPRSPATSAAGTARSSRSSAASAGSR